MASMLWNFQDELLQLHILNARRLTRLQFSRWLPYKWSVSLRSFPSMAMFERAYRSGIGLLVIHQVRLFQNGFLGALNG